MRHLDVIGEETPREPQHRDLTDGQLDEQTRANPLIDRDLSPTRQRAVLREETLRPPLGAATRPFSLDPNVAPRPRAPTSQST